MLYIHRLDNARNSLVVPCMRDFLDNLSQQRKRPAGGFLFKPQTPLAHKLWTIRSKIIVAGIPMLNDKEIGQEIILRRGGLR